ncbi:MAG: chromosomal replication initiator protein DnaA [Rhodothermales bacterium]
MERPTDILWQDCKRELQGVIAARPFQTWLEPISLLSAVASDSGMDVELEVPSDFHRDWIEQNYLTELQRVLNAQTGAQVAVRFSTADVAALAGMDDEQVAPWTRTEAPSAPANGSRNGGAADTGTPLKVRPESMPGAAPRTLNANYTFDSFIEADCNRLARSAGIAVAQQPGETSFNPFLIYGRVGLGKTHLAHAIGNQIAGSNPRTQVLYMTSEAFTNCFVQAIQNNTLGEFTTTFRQIDVLIVDDIQFFGGKEKTQEQFFHLFNDLHQRGKQIILCADRSPAEIAGIEERLLSRFRWGLSADVQPPDLETRTAILQSHCQRTGLDLAPDVIDYIAYNVKDNIRLLEGAFNRLFALNRITNQELDLAFVQNALQDLIETRVRKTISATQIRDIVAEYYHLDPNVMIGKSRKRPIVDARQVAMHFCKHMTQLSLEAIGRHFGGRDHSTVIHACKAIQARLDTDSRFTNELKDVERLLAQRVLH